MQSLIKTESSFLNVYSCEEYGELIKKCIEEVKDELLVNPPIQIYHMVLLENSALEIN